MQQKPWLILTIALILGLSSMEPAQASLWALVKAAGGLKSVLVKTPAVAQSAKPMRRQHYSLQLRKNMTTANKTCSVAWQAHHIIPVALASHRAIHKCGVDINAAANGLCMPGAKAKVQGRIQPHHGYHASYNRAVQQALDGIPRLLSKAKTCQRIEQIQTCFRRGLQRGTPLYGENVAKAWGRCQR